MIFGKILPLIFLFISHNLYSFTLSNSAAASFPGDHITIDAAAHNCNNIGMNNNQLLDLIQEAVTHYWNEVPTSRLRLKKGDLTTVSALFQTDLICLANTDCTPNPSLVVTGGILVSCNTSSGNFTSNAVLAVTVPNHISGRDINGALILINDRSDSQFRNKSHAEQVAILAHEIGHAIGLGHSEVDDSLMYFRSVPSRYSLGQDDIDGLSYLYPAEQPVKGCGSIADINSDDQKGKGLFSFLLGILLIMAVSSFLKKKSVFA